MKKENTNCKKGWKEESTNERKKKKEQNLIFASNSEKGFMCGLLS